MSSSANQGFDFEGSYRLYLDGLLAADRRQCQGVFEKWLASDASVRDIYQNLVQRSLYEIGALWAQGTISVAVEHLATAITENLLNLAYPRLFSRPRSGRSAVVACVPDEFHQIGGRMVADTFEFNGWRSYYLGSNFPSGAMNALIKDKRPDAVALSATLMSRVDALISAAGRIRDEFPELPILAGGQALLGGGRQRVERLPSVRCLSSLQDLEAWIKETGNV